MHKGGTMTDDALIIEVTTLSARLEKIVTTMERLSSVLERVTEIIEIEREVKR